LDRAPFLNDRKRKHLMYWAQQKGENLNEESRYLNVAGGEREEMLKMCEWWGAQKGGYDVRVTAGPALTSSLQGSDGRFPSDQAYTPGSLMTTYKRVFEEAYETVLEFGSAVENDELSSLVAGIDGPKWNSHSCRKGGTKRARELMDFSKVNEQAIDRHFRWKSETLTREQQVAYAGMVASRERCMVTLYF